MAINLDSTANHPPLPEVLAILGDPKFYANPHSGHEMGEEAMRELNKQREIILSRFPAFFEYEAVPGGGSMANYRAILDSIPFHPYQFAKGRYRDKVILSPTEHKSIHDTIRNRLSARGYTVLDADVTESGEISILEFRRLVDSHRDEIALVSIHWVNNETGVFQPIEKLRESIPEHAIFHSDAAHAMWTVSQATEIPSIVTFSGYKIGGPHMGLLLMSKGIKLEDSYGGTPDLRMTKALATAITIHLDNCLETTEYIAGLSGYMRKQLHDLDAPIKIIRSTNMKMSIVSVILPGEIEGKWVQKEMGKKGVYIASGSACSSQKKDGSHVMTAMGFAQQSKSSIRFSFLSTTTREEIDIAVGLLRDILVEKGMMAQPEAVTSAPALKKTEKPSVEFDTPKDLQIRSYNCIRLGYGELYLKGKNRSRFVDCLIRNTKHVLKMLDMSGTRMKNTHSATTILGWSEKLFTNLKQIPGYARISAGMIISNDDSQMTLNMLAKVLLSVIFTRILGRDVDEPRIGFCLRTKILSRSKWFGRSGSEWNILLGQLINDRFRESVVTNLTDPDITIEIRIDYSTVMILPRTEKGAGGLPAGSEGNSVLHMYDGSDPVWAFDRMVRRGLRVHVMKHFATGEHDPASDLHLSTIKNKMWLSPGSTVVGESQTKTAGMMVHVSNNIISTQKHLKLCLQTMKANEEREKAIHFNPFFFTDPSWADRSREVSSLVLLSGGFDSPVAAEMLNERGLSVSYVHFTTDIGKTEVVKKIQLHLRKMYPDGDHRLWVVQFGDIQDKIRKVGRESYRTLMYKVFMLKIANEIAEIEGIDCLATGNSLGQVASQTPSNLLHTRLMSERYILSPLLLQHKNDIVTKSREMDLERFSLEEGTEDCCTRFLPAHPVTKSHWEQVAREADLVGDYKSMYTVTLFE